MKTISRNFALSLALLAGTTGVAFAGGDFPSYGYGSSKDGYVSDGIPVPAPAPIPNYRASWYFRADFGYGTGGAAKPSLSQTHGAADAEFPFNLGCAMCGPTIYSNPVYKDDNNSLLTGGVGAGYYWTSRIRTDLTAEFRGENKIKVQNNYNYLKYGYDTPGGVLPPVWVPVDAANDLRVFGKMKDETDIRGGVFLLNAYYDFNFGGRFTPYVGGGVGVAVNTLSRSQTIDEYECSVVIDPSCLWPTARPSVSAKEGVTTFSLAAAAMAGVSYKVSASTHLDMNYRMLWLQGTQVDMNVGGQPSKLTIADTLNHQVRAGLRFDLD